MCIKRILQPWHAESIPILYLKSTFKPIIKPSLQSSVIAHAVKEGVLTSIMDRHAAIHCLRCHLHI